jgi:RNA polymerase sigma-70 factor (ECF subfamily)
MITIDEHTDHAGDEAMARYAGGDDTAFAAVYTAINPKLTRFLSRRVSDPALVQDLAQETLLRLHRARARFVPGSPVMPWVLGIARRQLIDAHRARRNETPLDEGAPAPEHRNPAVGDSPASAEEIVAAKQVAGCLSDAFERLSQPQRAAFELVKGRGLTLVEAARELGTSVTGVKLRTHRAYCALRSELAAAA